MVDGTGTTSKQPDRKDRKTVGFSKSCAVVKHIAEGSVSVRSEKTRGRMSDMPLDPKKRLEQLVRQDLMIQVSIE